MNGMFTDRVKKVMQLAREESVRLGNDYVGTEHLLLGLIREGEGVAIAVLKNVGSMSMPNLVFQDWIPLILIVEQMLFGHVSKRLPV